MAAEQNFAMFAAQYDDALRAGADAAMRAGLARVRELMPFVLVPLVVGCGVLFSIGQLDRGRLFTYGFRVCLFLWLVVGMAYVPHVSDLVVDAVPNEIASVVNGGGNAITSARQFDVLDEAVAHFVAQIKGQATGLWHIPTRVSADASRAIAKFWLELVFYVWIAMRMATRLLVAAAVFLLPFIFFDSTRGWLMQMFGKFVGVSVWHLMTAILAAVMVAGMQVYLRAAIASPGASIDEMLEQLGDIGGWFLGCFILLLILPALAGVGSGYVASAAQGTILGMAAAGARLAAGAGGAAGRATAGALRRIARNTRPPRTSP